MEERARWLDVVHPKSNGTKREATATENDIAMRLAMLRAEEARVGRQLDDARSDLKAQMGEVRTVTGPDELWSATWSDPGMSTSWKDAAEHFRRELEKTDGVKRALDAFKRPTERRFTFRWKGQEKELQ